jgi:ribosome-binding factor A
MAREFGRTDRVADFLKRELARLVQFELRDPRIGMVSITDVEVTRDLAHAKVFVTVMGKDSATDAKESIDALNNASGFMRSQVASVSNTRTVPRLRFVFDTSVVHGQHMSALIDAAVKQDRHAAEGEAVGGDAVDGNAVAGDDNRDGSREDSGE